VYIIYLIIVLTIHHAMTDQHDPSDNEYIEESISCYWLYYSIYMWREWIVCWHTKTI